MELFEHEIKHLTEKRDRYEQALLRAKDYNRTIEHLDLTQSQIDYMVCYYYHTELSACEAFVAICERERGHRITVFGYDEIRAEEIMEERR